MKWRLFRTGVPTDVLNRPSIGSIAPRPRLPPEALDGTQAGASDRSGWHQTCSIQGQTHLPAAMTMKVSTNELLLALRAPNSGWLAALICALDEALQDPDFGEPQRALVRSLLDAGMVPNGVAVAANDRLTRFEETVKDLHSLLASGDGEPVAEVKARPKLTLCGSAA